MALSLDKLDGQERNCWCNFLGDIPFTFFIDKIVR